MTQLKTFIRWMGNKSRHLKKISPFLPDALIDGTFDGTYFEPFLGTGAMFLRLQPKKWIINDLNKDLVNVWKHVMHYPTEVKQLFEQFECIFKPLKFERKKQVCQELTAQIEDLSFTLERAVIFVLMKFCSFSGNIQKNNKFFFDGIDRNIYSRNVYTFLNDAYYENIENIKTYITSTKGLLYNKQYTDILIKTKKGDFVFLDPPYVENHSYGFYYNKDEILDTSFVQTLYNQVQILDKKGVLWMMTQSDTNQIRKMFKEYTIKKFKVYRGHTHSYTYELIIMNY
jgi:DNA adenine methylase